MRIARVFLNVSMIQGHDGLVKIVRSFKLKGLTKDDLIVFINRKRNRCKILSGSDVVAYLRLPKGLIDLNAIQYIPQSLGALGQLHYDEGLKKSLLERLAVKDKNNGIQKL